MLAETMWMLVQCMAGRPSRSLARSSCGSSSFARKMAMLQFPPISLLKIDANIDLRKGQSRWFILSMTEAPSLRSISGNGPPLARHSDSMTHGR